MPQDIVDIDTFTDPIVEMADADPLDPTYVRTALQGLANRTRHLHANQAPRTVRRQIAAVDYTRYAEADWTFPSHLGYLHSAADVAYLFIPLRVVSGETLYGCTIKVKPGAARSGTARMLAQIVHTDNNFGGGTPGIAALAILFPDSSTTIREDDGGTGYQALSLVLSTPAAVGDDDTFYVQLTAGATGLAAPDEVRDTYITLTTEDRQ